MNEDIEEFNAWLNAKDGKFYGMAREYIISIGHAEERERIIELLKDNSKCALDKGHDTKGYCFCEAVTIIKNFGE